MSVMSRIYFLLCFFLHSTHVNLAILGELCFPLVIRGCPIYLWLFISLALQVCLTTNARWRWSYLPFPCWSCSSSTTGWTRKNLREIIWEWKGGSHSVYTKKVFSSLPGNVSMSVTLKLIREIFSIPSFRHHPAFAYPPWPQDKYFVFLLSIRFPVLSLLLLLLCVDKHCCPWSYTGLFVKI